MTEGDTTAMLIIAAWGAWSLANLSARAGRIAAAQTCAREMTPICAAVLLANLKQVERIIAAKNRKPIVVECRR